MFGGGKNHKDRVIKQTKAYLKKVTHLSEKLKLSKDDLVAFTLDNKLKTLKLVELNYYEKMIDKHIDLVHRRVILDEKIPHSEKLFSLFEPYTRWVNKGKSGNRIELGLPVAICSDQFGFILNYYVMETEQDVKMTVPLVTKLLNKWENIESFSLDKGYWSKQNYDDLKDKVEQLIMPKKGNLNKTEKERETSKKFIALRHQHAAIESDINALEHHGLNRCLDKGKEHFKNYVGLGVLSLNLHRLGNVLLKSDREQVKQKAAA